MTSRPPLCGLSRNRRPGPGRSATVLALGIALIAGCGPAPGPTPEQSPAITTPVARPTSTGNPPPPLEPRGDFTAVSRIVNDAIAAPRLPGAVIQVGHGGKVVFRQAFGQRKLAGEPGLDGSPSPAEPMTEDTIFDVASLTKVLATSTAVLQLHEQGRIGIDDPVQTYLPEFNPRDDPRRSAVTLRMLLTHTSGIGGDLSRQGAWGLLAADRDDGIRRALSAPLEFEPGEVFHYSDIGFILLGLIVEKITGEALDDYTRANVFGPLGMTDTAYLAGGRACGPHRIRGTAVAVDLNSPEVVECPDGSWSIDLLARIAPTARDEDTPGINPNIGNLLRGTVHDPTARRMGGATGSAGVFSTVHDVGRYAQALLDRLAGRPSVFPLTQASLQLMTTPQQPGHHAAQLDIANNAARAAVANTPNASDPLLAPFYPAVPGQYLRGFGWDIDTYQSTPRGVVFPVGSFGHTGFTGVTLWIDPGSDSYVVVLGNVIHQRGGPPIVELSGDVATLAARALHLYGT